MIKKSFLEVFCGPMKSGKSRELLNRIDKLKYLPGASYILFKPSTDNRSQGIKTRFGNIELDCKSIKSPNEILEMVKPEHQVVGIDETHFFDSSIIPVIKELLKREKHILIAGLDLDFRGEPFGPMPHILSIANEVYKFSAVCQYHEDSRGCELPATRTQRLINGKPAPYESPRILIGDEKEGYEPRCIKHHQVPKKS